MLLRSLTVPRSEFEAGTGWRLKPEGACHGDVCIPLSQPAGDPVDVARLAKDIGMPLVARPNTDSGRWGLRQRVHVRWQARRRRICDCPS